MDAAAIPDFAARFHDFLELLREMLVAREVAELEKLYREESRLNFEGQKIRGKEKILAQLTSHPFARRKRRITTVDCHPSNAAGGQLVFVNGVLDEDGEGHALNFSQLMPTPEGDFYILNDMFRVATPPQSQVMEGVLAHVATAIHT